MFSLVNKYKSFKNKQDGTATIEFVFLFPAFIFLFLTGFEAGYYMVRNVMLERAVDVAVRDVRLGNGKVPGFNGLKAQICSEVGIISDCMNKLQVEMQPLAVTPGGTAPARGPIRCVDTSSLNDPFDSTVYQVGSQGSLMVVRVCALSKPLFPTTGIGVGMRVDVEGNYALVATTAFVNEPGSRAMNVAAASNPIGSTVPNESGSNMSDAGSGNGNDGGDPGASEAVNSGGDETSTNPGNGNL